MQTPNPQNHSLLRLTATQVPTLMTLSSHSKVSNHLQLLIIVVETRFYQCLIVGLALVDACVVRRHNTSHISQEITHTSLPKVFKT